MRPTPARRSLLRVALLPMLLTPTAGCAGALVNAASALDAAAGNQYEDFSEANDRVLTCSNGRPSPGYVRLYHGSASNQRYVYMFNASTVPVTLEVRWGDASTDSEVVASGQYSGRYTRYILVRASTGASYRCGPA